MLTYTAANQLGAEVSILNNLAAMLFILPYFLFSALAGQIADKFEKSKLTRLVKILEIVIMTVAAIGFVFEWYVLLFVALFLIDAILPFLVLLNMLIYPKQCEKMSWLALMAYFRWVRLWQSCWG